MVDGAVKKSIKEMVLGPLHKKINKQLGSVEYKSAKRCLTSKFHKAPLLYEQCH